MTADAEYTIQTKTPEVVTTTFSVTDMQVCPSRYNARTVAQDGSLLVFNSYTGAFASVPDKARVQAENLLKQKVFQLESNTLAKYMYDRGFLVSASTNELSRLRSLHGHQHYRSDTLQLILLASEECNFRCTYCYESFKRGTMEPWVREAVIALAKQQIEQLRYLQISWFGGEPLLGMEAIRDISPVLQQMALENKVNYSSDMTTNGFLLDQRTLQELLGYGIRSFQITLDGSPKDHDSKRMQKNGATSFDTIYQNLMSAHALTDTFSIIIRINFDQNNIDQIQDLFNLLKTDFSNDARFHILLFPIGRWGGSNDEKLNVCGSNGFANQLEMENLAISMGLKTQSRLSSMQAKNDMGVCYAARPYSMIIGANGTIMKCTVALDKMEDNIIGKLFPNGMAQINQERLEKWTEQSFENDDKCKKCFYSPVCQGCSCPKARLDKETRPCPANKQHFALALKSIWEQRGSVTSTMHAVGEDNRQASSASL